MTMMLADPVVRQVTPCRVNPDCWTQSGDDPVLKSLCREVCPRRVQCAREALTTPGAVGVWAGFYLPPDDDSPRHDHSRAYAYGMTRLRVIAALGDRP